MLPLASRGSCRSVSLLLTSLRQYVGRYVLYVRRKSGLQYIFRRHLDRESRYLILHRPLSTLEIPDTELVKSADTDESQADATDPFRLHKASRRARVCASEFFNIFCLLINAFLRCICNFRLFCPTRAVQQTIRFV